MLWDHPGPGEQTGPAAPAKYMIPPVTAGTGSRMGAEEYVPRQLRRAAPSPPFPNQDPWFPL